MGSRPPTARAPVTHRAPIASLIKLCSTTARPRLTSAFRQVNQARRGRLLRARRGEGKRALGRHVGQRVFLRARAELATAPGRAVVKYATRYTHTRNVGRSFC